MAAIPQPLATRDSARFPMPLTRLAPSPTGTLHLGNARTFLMNWAMARQRDWQIVLRIEDLDVSRVRPHATAQAIEQLRWLGLDWDIGPVVQSDDLAPYRAAMQALADRGHVFACDLTRRQIEAATSAPHAGDREVRFPASLRPSEPKAWRFDDESTNYRFATPEDDVAIYDGVCHGNTKPYCHPIVFRPSRECGDFIVWTRIGAPAYQLAVVVDDARQGITDVVRGDDLLPSAARQTLLYQALGYPPPRWHHLPLVLGPHGRRLAKRDGDMHLQTCRERGIRSDRVVGLVAHWCGLLEKPGLMSAQEFKDEFDLVKLPADPVTFTQEQLTWLMDQ